MSELGIMPDEKDLINDHILYLRGSQNTPFRFYDFVLVNKHRAYNHNALLHNGFHIGNLESVVNRFNGISWEYLKN